MSFFFEVLIGGLLSGVMYSLVALGFVLIYKASGVFNFAQGAMVFFAALTFVGFAGARAAACGSPCRLTLVVMVRRSASPSSASCCGRWSTSRRSRCSWRRSASPSSSRASRSCCGAPTCARSTSASQDEPLQWLLDRLGHRRSRKFDLIAAGVAAVLVAALALCSSADPDRPRAARRGRRSPGRARGRHSAAADLGHRVGGGRLRRAGRRAAVGRAQRRAVRADLRRAEGAAGADPRRLRLDAGRDRRRPDHRRVGEAGRGLSRPDGRRRHRRLVPVRAGARCSCWCGPKACSAKRSSGAI